MDVQAVIAEKIIDILSQKNVCFARVIDIGTGDGHLAELLGYLKSCPACHAAGFILPR